MGFNHPFGGAGFLPSTIVLVSSGKQFTTFLKMQYWFQNYTCFHMIFECVLKELCMALMNIMETSMHRTMYNLKHVANASLSQNTCLIEHAVQRNVIDSVLQKRLLNIKTFS